MSWVDREERDRRILNAVGERVGNSGGWMKVSCPFCLERVGKEDRSRSFAYNDRNGFFRCFRCATKGRVAGNWDENFDKPAEERKPDPTKIDRPPEYIPLWTGPGRTSRSLEPARVYLRKRGLEEDVWRHAQIGAALEGRFAHRVIIPALSPRGDWRGYVSRTWLKHERGCECRHCAKPYLNATNMSAGVFMYNDAVLGEKTETPVLAVEGCFDVLALRPHAAVAFLGKPKRAQVEMLAAAPRPVVVVMDGDAWEVGWGMAMELRLLGQRAGAVRLPPKKDPDQVEKSWLIGEAIRSMNDVNL